MILNATRIRIMEEFLRDYKIRLTGSTIAKNKGLNQKTVANSLKEFEEMGILRSTMQGKNKLYYLNLDDKKTIENFISAVEYLRTMEFYKKQPLIKEIITKIVPYCKGIVAIFGSYAKGTQKKDSDLDILIGSYNLKEIEKISKMYKIEINIKHYPLNSFRKALINKDPLTEEVIKNHILILDAEKFVSFIMRFRYGKD